MRILLGLFLVAMTTVAAAQTETRAMGPAGIKFEYRRLVEPWESFACEHEKSPVGSYEYDVVCALDNQSKKYSVHLALQFYPKTVHGSSAYELLYWVTDFSDMTQPKSSSTTLWVHNSSEENRMKVLEASQGLENDLAALRLEILLPKH